MTELDRDLTPDAMTRVFSSKTLAIVLTIGLGAAVVLSGCEPGDQPGPEYMPDMARGPAYKAFAPNAATRSGITLQRPVAGTIKRGFHPFHYGKGDAEATRAGVELTNPFHPTEPTLTKGKALYETYCLVCHGEQGKGDGPISTKIPPPPSYKSERLLAYPPGRFFHVVTMGANKMPSYAVQLTPDERWLVITYVRAQLQGLPEAAPGIGEGMSAATGEPADDPAATDSPAPAPPPPPAPTGAAAGAAAVPAPAPVAGAPRPVVPAGGSVGTPNATPPVPAADSKTTPPAPVPAAGSAKPPAATPAAAAPAPAAGSGDHP